MTPLQHKLSSQCERLGLKIKLNFSVIVDNGIELVAEALLPELGPPLGMLIFRSGQYEFELIRMLGVTDFGYSQLTSPDDPVDYDLDAAMRMFSDWGWNGDTSRRPSWMVEPPDDDDDDGEDPD